MAEHDVERWVFVFRRDNETLADELPLDVPIAALQALFGVATDNPMLECYPVTERERDQVEAWLGVRLDLERFDYFVEATAK